jgi:site-specific DNA recombinase
MNKNAIGYIRISTRDQSKYSLDDQADAVREYCQHYGLELLNIFRDNGEHSDTFDRADFIALEQYIKKLKGHVRYLIVMAHDRFSRDLSEALRKIRELERKYRIKVLAVDEPLDIDPEDPDVFMQRAFKYLMANQELLSIRKRTRRGIHNAMAAGRFVQKAPLGYVNAKDESGKGIIVVDEAKAAIIQEIFRLYLSGMPYFRIAQEMRSKGFKLTGNGSIQVILGNCVYAGLIRVPAYNKKPERLVKGLHDALVTELDYWKVQELMGKNKRPSKAQPKEDVPLRGVLKCWCGKNMTAGWSKGKYKYYLYYRCTKHTNVNVSGIILHRDFGKLLGLMNLDEKQVEYVRASAGKKLKEALSKREKQLGELRKVLGALEQKIHRLEEKMMNDEIEGATYKKWSGKYSEEKAALLSEILKLNTNYEEKWNRLSVLLGELTRLPELFEELPVRKKHMLVKGVFKHGLVYSEGSYRTPWLHPAVSHNELIMKEKGLLVVEQPNAIWNQIPVSSLDRNRTCI